MIASSHLDLENYPARYWTSLGEDKIRCDLCPRLCHLKEGQRGFCFVRKHHHGKMVLTTYGRSSGFCIDPIEKKPLHHFYPGSSVLSFGTAGCNLGCRFCQNWDISKARQMDRLNAEALPETIAERARQSGCKSVAFTYNDPVIFLEYAVDTARACRERDIKTVAVTAGYIEPEARKEFYSWMDAVNVDLKAFSDTFYGKVTFSQLSKVLETLHYIHHETNVWLEITNLVIPGQNDSREEIKAMCDWVAENLSSTVPIHFSAFHPDFKMQDIPRTPPETLQMAYEIATKAGLQFVYVGNIHDLKRDATYCPNCKNPVIKRDWYELLEYGLKGDRCSKCYSSIPGHFDSNPGNWGRKRIPVRI